MYESRFYDYVYKRTKVIHSYYSDITLKHTYNVRYTSYHGMFNYILEIGEVGLRILHSQNRADYLLASEVPRCIQRYISDKFVGMTSDKYFINRMNIDLKELRQNFVRLYILHHSILDLVKYVKSNEKVLLKFLNREYKFVGLGFETVTSLEAHEEYFFANYLERCLCKSFSEMTIGERVETREKD